MDKQELVAMLNRDVADEHVSIVRYLIHAYQAGEDTPLGSMMLSVAREEMWHMNWLADAVGELGGEPSLALGVYPHDPTSNASLLRSYIVWEDNLIVHYTREAALVDDPEISKALRQAGIESVTHSKRFAAMLAKLGPAGEEPLVYEDTGAFSPQMVDRFNSEMSDEYQLVLQHLRHAFVFEGENCPVGSGLELTAMRHMKHLSIFAEEIAEAGHHLDLVPPEVDMSAAIEPALGSDLKLTEAARERFDELRRTPELREHPGLQTELEHMIDQEEFLAFTVKELIEVAESAAPAGGSSDEPEQGTGPQFTVGSLIQD